MAKHGRHERRRSPRDGVDLAEVAEPIGFSQRQVVADVNYDRGTEIGPSGGLGQAGQECKGNRYEAGRYGDQDGGEDRFESQFKKRVPARVAGSRGEHGAENKKVHRPASFRPEGAITRAGGIHIAARRAMFFAVVDGR